MKTGLAFEDRVAGAIQALRVFSGPNVRLFQNKVYPGAKDRQGYEIDIALELEFSPGLTLLVIVECKEHSRPVARAVVQQMIQVRDDISAHKA